MSTLETKNELTEEQERMWKRLSEPYVPPYTGTDNIAIGYAAGAAINTGSQNIALGYQALAETVGIPQNIFMGRNTSDV